MARFTQLDSEKLQSKKRRRALEQNFFFERAA
jgi:hypothetical protein